MKKKVGFLLKGLFAIIVIAVVFTSTIIKTTYKAEAAVKEWEKDSIYVAGDQVSRKGVIYEASWWTQGEDPAKQTDEWGVWKPVDTNKKPVATEDTAAAEDTAATKDTAADKTSVAEPEKTPDTAQKDTAETTKKETAKKETTSSTDKNTGLAAHVVTGYWQNFDNGAKCLKISDVPKGYNLIAVAFAESTTTPGKVTFRLDETLCQRLAATARNNL